ncbi:hypothetical protein T265_05970 [Opisthorchis viverrini]|uniref:Uncharacterized protein n=1 Tax=Opisthorchis viverrini TaxID=6198 RepID=A0A074ZTW8_OPIVI|nr:hypothetical protein T265_05970 [Opisthorchis viverrini]KER26835.1 hypothetical protein T265_05970 [Opisthorchis viverrini]
MQISLPDKLEKTHRFPSNYQSNSNGQADNEIRPPAHLLPPHPPSEPPFPLLYPQTTKEYTKLPPLSLSKADYFGRTTFPNQSTVKRVRKRILQVDAQTETVCVPQFRCLVCGLDCQRGDILYAHLLLLRHEFDASENHSIGGTSLSSSSSSSDRSGRLHCRRCGRRWESEVEFLCSNQHSCVQQKAAYLSGFLAPSDSIRQGLPFVCLLCCTEPQENGARRSYPIRTQNGLIPKRPLKPHEAAMRFTSKIHLVVHILCRHAVRRKSGMCAECPLVKLESPTDEDGSEESAFWCLRSHERKPKLLRILSVDSDNSSSDSDAETVSPVHSVDYSMLRREGLQSIEKHIDEYHLPMFELITWYMQHSSSPQSMNSNMQRTAMYSCPICDLNNLRLLPKSSSTSGEDYSSTFGECAPINSNALLQAHIVCYHAGAKELDALLEVCQVCETSDLARMFRGTRPECSTEHAQGANRHLSRSGHLYRLQCQFERCVGQGRLDSGSLHVSLDWSTVCLFCWRRYATHLGSPMANLVAQSRLQTHLLVQHCAQLGEGRSRCCQELDTFWLKPCGWCGATASSREESGKLCYCEHQSICYRARNYLKSYRRTG